MATAQRNAAHCHDRWGRREEIETAAPARLRELLRSNAARIDSCQRLLAAAFRDGDLAVARHTAVQLQYLTKIGSTIMERLDAVPDAGRM